MSELLEKRRMRIKQMKEANREAKGESQSEATDQTKAKNAGDSE